MEKDMINQYKPQDHDATGLESLFTLEHEEQQAMLFDMMIDAEIATVPITLSNSVSYELAETTEVPLPEGGTMTNVKYVDIICALGDYDRDSGQYDRHGFVIQFTQEGNSDRSGLLVLVKRRENGNISMHALLGSERQLADGTPSQQPEVEDVYMRVMSGVMQEVANFIHYGMEWSSEEGLITIRNDLPPYNGTANVPGTQ